MVASLNASVRFYGYGRFHTDLLLSTTAFLVQIDVYFFFSVSFIESYPSVPCLPTLSRFRSIVLSS